MVSFGLTLANRGVIIGAVTVPELFDMGHRRGSFAQAKTYLPARRDDQFMGILPENAAKARGKVIVQSAETGLRSSRSKSSSRSTRPKTV